MKGWIYVFSNRAMPNLVKIGYTDRDPSIRVAEQHSGLPYPHDLEYETLLYDAYELEQQIHEHLKANRESKEWFRLSVEDAVCAVKELVGDKSLFENYHKAERVKVEKMQLARRRQEQVELERAEQRRRQDTLFETEKQRILAAYRARLNELPSSKPVGLKLIEGFLYLVFFGGMITLMLDNPGSELFFIPVLLFFLWAVWPSESQKEKERQETPEYKKIVAEREAEITKLRRRIYR